MKNLINTIVSIVAKNQSTTLEASNPNTPIHNDLTMYYLILVEELKKYSSKEYDALVLSREGINNNIYKLKEAKVVIENGIEREKSNIGKLGFANAKSERLKRYEEKLFVTDRRIADLVNERKSVSSEIHSIMSQQTTKDILQHLKKDFGEEALFVRYDDFEKVINKYNFVCGRLSDYKGVLPENKMADIKRVLTMKIPEFWENKISKLYNGYEIISSRNYNDVELRFPFYTSGNLPLTGWILDAQTYTFFIAAPAHEMMTEKELREKAIAERRARDPFICAHTKWGIIIFTKWGEEAEDEIIKKYKNMEG